MVRFARYGYRRVTAQLKREGYLINHKRSPGLCRKIPGSADPKANGLSPPRLTPNTQSLKNKIKGLNISGINQVWVADLTAIRIQGAFAYLALVVDVYSRKIIGWALAWQKTEDLTKAALKMALERRKPKPGWIHHSDRGAQYASGYYVALVKAGCGKMSMSAKGKPYENSIMARYIRTIKREEVKLCEYQSITEAYQRLE